MRLLFMILVLFSSAALAMVELEPLSSPELQQRYQVLIEELRCPKCQNQNLADSNSPISADMRNEIRLQLEQGNSDRQIKDFLVERYGNFVLYKPPVDTNTVLLWIAPLLLLLIAGFVVFRISRAQSVANGPVDWSEQEEQAVNQLLARENAAKDPAEEGRAR